MPPKIFGSLLLYVGSSHYYFFFCYDRREVECRIQNCSYFTTGHNPNYSSQCKVNSGLDSVHPNAEFQSGHGSVGARVWQPIIHATSFQAHNLVYSKHVAVPQPNTPNQRVDHSRSTNRLARKQKKQVFRREVWTNTNNVIIEEQPHKRRRAWGCQWFVLRARQQRPRNRQEHHSPGQCERQSGRRRCFQLVRRGNDGNRTRQ